MAKANKQSKILEKAQELRQALQKLDEATGSRSLWTVNTQAEVGEFFGVTINGVKGWNKQGMPGRPGAYRLDVIAQWLRSEGPWQRRGKAVSDDPLLSDGDSPALERYRLAKAQHAELDLEHRKGSLLEREKARDILSRWGSIIRRLGERMAKRYGNEAAVAVNETLEECSELIQRELGRNG